MAPGNLHCGVLLALELAARAAQGPQSPQPCVNDCLLEALAPVPVRGCTAGTYWAPYPPTAIAGSCRPCPEGFYCPGEAYGEFPDRPVNVNRRIACPVGTYMDIEGSHALSQCKACARGKFNDWYGKASCKLCPAGTYVDSYASESVADCMECPAGHFCPEGSPEPIPCVPGLYTRNEGMRDSAACLACPLGHYCPRGTVVPLPCPAGDYGNATGIRGLGEYPGTYGFPGVVIGDECTPCPASFFCPERSVLPTSCPPGTTSGMLAEKELDCADCPVGQRCQQPVNIYTAQSLVVREANGEQMVGSVSSEACAVDTTVHHFSYPSVRGCTEHCPYQFERQSYCHVSGDGRTPDRTWRAQRLAQLVSLRGASGEAQAVRDGALAELADELGNLTAEERAAALGEVDRNGRTPLLAAALLGDEPLLRVLWIDGGLDASALAARDVEGYTPLMRALQLGHAAAAAWLVASAGARLSADDAAVLQRELVAFPGVPVDVAPPLPAGVTTLGRAGPTWPHPSGAGFVSLPP
eukprot:TRINITY_DN30816_c0_g1_i1.p1 TRINITY_DN30816_c0_g1~~TRINITY_DN30816_c0_g1_i1.p1  ORF type:complete len:525 (+),score=93.37 TRINITY_DN30816_c0_g1_i1:158-1732(+)